MVHVETLYNIVIDAIDKNNGRFITEDEFNRLAHVAQLELFDDCIGATNKKLNNQTLVAYGKSQNTDKRLEPFRANATKAVVEGEVELPSDCEKLTAVLTSKRSMKALIRIDEDRIGMLYDNPLREPNEDEIYYLEDNYSLQVFGIIGSVYLAYLRTPRKPLYKTKEVDITAGTRTVKRKVFDEVNSVHLEWNEREAMDIANRILAKLSIPTRDSFLAQNVQLAKNNE